MVIVTAEDMNTLSPEERDAITAFEEIARGRNLRHVALAASHLLLVSAVLSTDSKYAALRLISDHGEKMSDVMRNDYEAILENFKKRMLQ
jgi:hypothetical protein